VFYAFGYNQYNIHNLASNDNKDNIHAEVNCVNKLKKSTKTKPINMIVFRTNNAGTSLGLSKPCEKCIHTIEKILNYKNYKLKKLWYTNKNGEFIIYK